MSNEALLKFLQDTIDIGNHNLELYKQVFEDQKECYLELIECRKEMIKQDELITALAKEVINLQERIDVLEGKKPGSTAKVRSKIKKINEELSMKESKSG